MTIRACRNCYGAGTITKQDSTATTSAWVIAPCKSCLGRGYIEKEYHEEITADTDEVLSVKEMAERFSHMAKTAAGISDFEQYGDVWIHRRSDSVARVDQ